MGCESLGVWVLDWLVCLRGSQGSHLLGISQLWEARFCRIKAPNAKLETVVNTGA